MPGDLAPRHEPWRTEIEWSCVPDEPLRQAGAAAMPQAHSRRVVPAKDKRRGDAVCLPATNLTQIAPTSSHDDRGPIEAMESETAEYIRVQPLHFAQNADRHLLALQEALHHIAAVVNA
ncbi:MAG TPA: hypothetical protein VHQ21_16005, partial [Rhodanobacteraceae bacterium]|nr:hypothetical protein [Rhodanobacteraceae bacterium]